MRDDIPCDSPPTPPFVEPLPTHTNGGMVLAQDVPAFSNAGACPPQINPCPIPTEGRTRPHQALAQFPPQRLIEVYQRRTQVIMHPNLPPQPVWGFARPQDPPNVAWSPGPTYVARYNQPILVRNFNDLPANNDGFGKPQVSTHLHNGHTPSESDGFPCDFFGRGKFYDHQQDDGRGPDDDLLPPGQGNKLLKFIVLGNPVPDGSADPTTQVFYPLPATTAPRVTRTFRFDRTNGQWAINNKLMDPECEDIRFVVQRNTAET